MNEPGAGTQQQKAPSKGGGSFGRILIGLGLLSEDQLSQALGIQQERSRRGDFARLGHILIELGFCTPEQVKEVLHAQAITILVCEACEAQFNVRGFSPDLRYECPKCHSSLRPAQELKHVSVQDQLEAARTGLDDTVRLTRIEDSNTARIRQLRLLGKYEILGELARGGMGIIYKARQLDLERIVALKTLRQEELAKPDAAGRFLHEAQAVASLRHPNIVAVHEVGTHDGIEYFTMEFIEGLPLDRRMLRESISPRESVETILPIADALDYAHRQGVVHRDLKPANIILDGDGVPFLVDWGIAKRLDEGLSADEEEDLLGSIPYMAPEYVEGEEYDELCDLYSLGVVLYEVLCGPNCLPYYDPDTRRFLEKIITEPPQPIAERRPELDEGLIQIVENMIASRKDRYQSMRAVVKDMRSWLVTSSSRQTAGEEDEPEPEEFAAAGPSRLARQAPGALPTPQTTLVALLALLAVFGLGWLISGALSPSEDRLKLLESQLGAIELRHAEELLHTQLEQATALVRLGAGGEALGVCTRAIEGAPEGLASFALADLYQLRADIYRARGDAAAAEADEERARELR